MPDYRGWDVISRLGGGGQGDVFLARCPARAQERRDALAKIHGIIPSLSAVGMDRMGAAKELAEVIGAYNRADEFQELGALKQYKLTQSAEGERALQRLRNEIRMLQELKGEGAALQLREVNADDHWIITDYHSRGSLSRYPEMFTGDACGALAALRPVVAVLAKLHSQGIVHRDIKTPNILISSTSGLILGDFGIVFLEADNRPTELLERVGTRDWMPPWAHTGMRVDDVKPSFDVFSLGKLMWCMISGKPMLPYWYYLRPPYDLTKQFPNISAMYAVNELLDKCVVETEDKCLPTASELLTLVDKTLETLRVGGEPIDDRVPRQCRVCGRGRYARLNKDAVSLAELPAIVVNIYGCESCGHIQKFGHRNTKYTPRANSNAPRFWDLPI